MTKFAAVLGALLALSAPVAGQDAKTKYSVKGDQFEACECEAVCPCIFQKDATMDQCRALVVWKVAEGSYGATDLKGLTFAASVTKSGKNMEKVMGKWEGVIFVPDTATEEQKKGLAGVITAEMGPAFAKVDVRSVAIQAKFGGDHYELSMGKTATMKISAIKNASGKVTVIENAPSPLALPKMHCAKSDVFTYDDGASKWDFSGRNAFYGAFEMKSK
jgi:hypothetical protein